MEKEKVVRLGVSLPSDLLRPFDRLVERRGYQSRSEAIRDLIRKTLIEEEWKESASDVAGTLTLVYDHHNRDLPGRLMDIQHDHHDLVVTTQHVHLDHHNCLEVLVLRGPAREIERLADRIIACNGVKHGVFVPSTTGRTIA
ncbi:MAG TPA: nickel-responsive transcriptional regulator NikR [Candidatus Desulfovibrio intestinipullorum]|uniref:Putative nickel-responsive regulator n=1 Tax=Candidatus Desulfovibrio intestinipullorum TaxID=2838536 RepID=A0A9D1PZ09_9BACT|nr:nickel-responsive transcriptional regulator NikR [Candidatus Desulfovibrio intestinipullorum]